MVGGPSSGLLHGTKPSSVGAAVMDEDPRVAPSHPLLRQYDELLREKVRLRATSRVRGKGCGRDCGRVSMAEGCASSE